MPLPTDPDDMGKCIRKFEEENPEGRSKRKKGEKALRKQALAACLTSTGQSKYEGKFLTFKEFLMEDGNS